MTSCSETPGSASAAHIEHISLIGAIARWCECLQNRAVVVEALELLAHSVDAEAIALSRRSHDPRGESRSLFFDRLRHKPTVCHLERSFAASVLGPYYRSASAGSLWLQSTSDIPPEPDLVEFQSRRKLFDLVVIPLSIEEKAIFFLEFHFATEARGPQFAMLNSIASTLKETWSHRRPGLMTELILNRKRPDPRVAGSRPLLGPDNPARLSRAEFRVCLMLSRGLSQQATAEELEICESTLRTHLGSIYEKTGTSGMAELLFHLLSGGTAASPPFGVGERIA